MRIIQVDLFQVAYRRLVRKYAWSGGRAVEEFASDIAKVSTVEGVHGYREVCPLGSAYMEAMAAGPPGGIREIATALIGADPTDIRGIYGRMDATLSGHDCVKSPIDIAFRDILGEVSKLPVSILLGRRLVEDSPSRI
jgi:L-alanine-DL-glutamate epimerase-like enolase superfamily enzyme